MDNVLRLTGLARKAGRLAVGEEPVGEAARSRTAKLILVAADAAENTLRRAQRFAANGDAPILPVPFTKAELGGAVGRPTCAMLAFTDVGLASAAAEKLSGQDPERYGPVAEALKERARTALARQKAERTQEKKRRAAHRRPPAAPKNGPPAPGKPRKKNGSRKPSRRHEA